jgi:hypothetical protein
MRRLPLILIMCASAIMLFVGVALAATHDRDPASSKASSVAVDRVASPATTAAVQPAVLRQTSEPAASTQPTTPAPHAAKAGDEKDCWDDCGDSGASKASVSLGSGGIDDDGDGGDCGGAD